MLQIYANIKDILVLLFSSALVNTTDLELLEMRNTFGLTFMIWFILECYWTTASLNCPVNFFLCASIQGNTLIFSFDAAFQLDMKEILLSSAGSISESIIPFLKRHNLLINQSRHFPIKMQIMFQLRSFFSLKLEMLAVMDSSCRSLINRVVSSARISVVFCLFVCVPLRYFNGIKRFGIIGNGGKTLSNKQLSRNITEVLTWCWVQLCGCAALLPVHIAAVYISVSLHIQCQDRPL